VSKSPPKSAAFTKNLLIPHVPAPKIGATVSSPLELRKLAQATINVETSSEQESPAQQATSQLDCQQNFCKNHKNVFFFA